MGEKDTAGIRREGIHSAITYLFNNCLLSIYSLSESVAHTKMDKTALYFFKICSLDGKIIILY